MILKVPEVIHNTCNMCARDLPDMYALSPWACGPRASGIHIRQTPRAHVTTITCNMGARDLPDMYVQSLRAYIHIRQIMSAHVTSNMYQFWYS